MANTISKPSTPRAVASPTGLRREPLPLAWADTGEPVGATLQLVPPFERRISCTRNTLVVTGVRIQCSVGDGQRVHVDLAAACTRMASVWDDRHLTPIALLACVPDNDDHAEQPDDIVHGGAVVVTTDPSAFLDGSDTRTEPYPNLATALVALASRPP